METTLTKPVFHLHDIRPDADRFDRNGLLGKGDGNCLVCNRRMNMADPRNAMAHMTVDGDLVHHDDDALAELLGISQGCFEVGPECAKRIPAGYVFIPGKGGTP